MAAAALSVFASMGLARAADVSLQKLAGPATEVAEISGGGPLAAREGQGSGFFVSPAGLIVTNGHVVAGCSEVEITGRGLGNVVSVDASVDLATVLPQTPQAAVPVTIAVAPARLGQTVIVLGYPLSDLLAHAITVTTGVISTEVGLGGDRRQFSMTASLEPGSSGGPVFDLRGQIVGVAASKMNAVAMILTTGSAGSNINFAVNAEALLTFLGRHGWTAPQAAGSRTDMAVEDAIAMVRQSTVELTCRPTAVGEP